MIRHVVLIGLLSALPSSFVYAKDEASKGKATKSETDNLPSKECTFVISGTDDMHYTMLVAGKEVKSPDFSLNIPKKCIDDPKGTSFTLNHVGIALKAAMGHNLIILETANLDKVVLAGISQQANDFIDPATKNLILGHTKVIGGKESDSFKLPKNAFDPKKDYSFVCSFPGHAAVMKGKIVFVESAAKS